MATQERVPVDLPALDFGERQAQRRLTFELAGREFVRTVLALAAFVLVALTVWWAYAASQDGQWGAAKEWLQVVLPAETGILGSALGFYFGSRHSAARPP